MSDLSQWSLHLGARVSLSVVVVVVFSLTDLSRGDDVLVLWVLIDGQAEDVVGVLQVETLASCRDRKQVV